jgi:hypothetical protein
MPVQAFQENWESAEGDDYLAQVAIKCIEKVEMGVAKTTQKLYRALGPQHQHLTQGRKEPHICGLTYWQPLIDVHVWNVKDLPLHSTK